MAASLAAGLAGRPAASARTGRLLTWIALALTALALTALGRPAAWPGC
ncbi:MAG TPA: hypothetical protein VFQ68_35655 [Streptosporangiaceae bacterium]|nr:hypothetical protein [Streptosporangiaceae bacterium]